MTYDWKFASVLGLIIEEQNVLGFQVRVGQVHLVQKVDSIQTLLCNGADLIYVKSLVVIVFNEVIKTLSEWLKNETHILGAANFVHKVLLQFDDIQVTPTLALQII